MFLHKSKKSDSSNSQKKDKKKLSRLKRVNLQSEYKELLPQDCADILLSLNNAHIEHLGELTSEKIQYFHRSAAYFLTAEAFAISGDIHGFLVGFCEGSRFASPYYSWLSRHYERFVFVERVVIEKPYQRNDVALHLLWPLMVLSVEYKIPIVTAVNYDPSNQEGLGFFLYGLDCYLVGREQINNDLEVVYFERTFSLEDLKACYERLQGNNKIMKITGKDVPNILKDALKNSKNSGKNHADANK